MYLLPLLGMFVLFSWLLLRGITYFESNLNRIETKGRSERSLTRIFSLLIGAMWMGEVLLGNLGDTPLLAWFRGGQPFHGMAAIFALAAVVCTGVAGFVAALVLGRIESALQVTVVSGFLSGVIVLAVGMGMEVVFHSFLIRSPSVLAEFARSGESGLTQFMYLDALAGGLNHLWIGPLLGVTVGSIGAGLGLLARRRPLAATI
jgi:hypothetical protein